MNPTSNDLSDNERAITVQRDISIKLYNNNLRNERKDQEYYGIEITSAVKTDQNFA